MRNVSNIKITKKQFKYVSLTLVAIIVIAVVGTFLFIGNYFYDITINSNTDKPFLLGGVAKTEESLELENVETATWQVQSYDGLALKSTVHLLDQGSDKWVIAVHGYANDSTYMKTYAKEFLQNGYNTLLPNCRGHGESDGEYIGMGWDDRFDIISWINEIIKYYPDSQIVLFGVSMGGTAVLNASGEALPKNVKCIVEQSGYSNLKELFAYQIDYLFGLPSFPIINAGNSVFKIRAGYSFEEASTIAQVSKSVTPIMFIHGSEDTVIPPYMMEEMYESATCKKERLSIIGAIHEETLSKNPDYYWENVWSFINEFVTNDDIKY